MRVSAGGFAHVGAGGVSSHEELGTSRKSQEHLFCTLYSLFTASLLLWIKKGHVLSDRSQATKNNMQVRSHQLVIIPHQGCFVVGEIEMQEEAPRCSEELELLENKVEKRRCRKGNKVTK